MTHTYILPIPSQLLEVPFDTLQKVEVPEKPNKTLPDEALIACIPVASDPSLIELIPVLTEPLTAILSTYLEVTGRDCDVTYYLVDLKEFTEMIANTLNELHA